MVRSGIRTALAVITGCLAVSGAGAVGAEERLPNIVFILADDLGIMDVGAFAERLSDTRAGEFFYEMLHIDALVDKGIAFTQAYANQLCSPTRAAILTGWYATRLGVTTATPRTRTYYNQGLPPPPGYSPHDAFAHADPIDGPLAWRNAHSNTAVSPGPADPAPGPGDLTIRPTSASGTLAATGHGVFNPGTMASRRSPTTTREAPRTSTGGGSGIAASPTTPRCPSRS